MKKWIIKLQVKLIYISNIFLESQTQEDSFVHKLLGDKFENAISVIADGIKKVISDVTEDEVRVNAFSIIFFMNLYQL